jgi:uncharacterized membrane protein YjdF
MTIQDFAVFIIVALAAVYLIRSWFVSSKSGGGCGKCSGAKGCASKAAPSEPQLVQIDLGGSWKRP